MSTNSRHATESQTTTPARSTPADAASAEATTETPDADDAASWVKRCQRQFDAGRTDRLRNLADEENQAMLD